MRQSVEPKPLLFRTVEDGLYDRIVHQQIAPGPGPALEGQGARER